MARFHADDADKYGGQGGAGYFSLKNHKDTALVRFMYNDINDVEGYAVHEIRDSNDKKRYVNCLREYNQPLDTCPFCREKMFTTAKLFIPIYNVDEDKVQVWERGKKFIGKISSICARYPNVVSHKFEIERNGAKGDTSTTYEIYEVGQDETILEDLPEFQDPLGTIVLDKTAEEMEYYLEHGRFESAEENDEPIRRRTSERREESTRRTPASNRREAF